MILMHATSAGKFQSTLPCGSDDNIYGHLFDGLNFNPRSLAGATIYAITMNFFSLISIHAPLRERLHSE